jgi:hypothetical protein
VPLIMSSLARTRQFRSTVRCPHSKAAGGIEVRAQVSVGDNADRIDSSDKATLTRPDYTTCREDLPRGLGVDETSASVHR